MATMHISETEAAKDFAGLLERVKDGVEVVIESDHAPVAVLRPADRPKITLITEAIAMAEAHASESGFEPVLDPDFAADIEDIVRNRRPRRASAWD